jgi:predicted acyl esterase
MVWELTDPERWVPHGYAIVRVASRGAGGFPESLPSAKA